MKEKLISIFRKFGYRITKSELDFNHFLSLYFSLIDSDDFYFIEVGANDGKTNDPLYDYVKKFDLSGVLVEPQKEAYDKLKENYNDVDGLDFANIALSFEDGYKKLYKPIDNLNMSGLASFEKSQVEKGIKRNSNKRFKDIDNYIETREVRTLCFETFIQEYNIEKIDLLQIDVEGFDFEIIKMIDFDKFSPDIINYENKNLTEDDRKSCERFLEKKGYRLFGHNLDGGDSCAFKKPKTC